MAKLLISVILILLIVSGADAQIRLNEISNKNIEQITDEDNEFDDWIEIFNPSASAVNLSDYYLSDDSTNLDKWRFPDYAMKSKQYLMVFASAKDRTVPPTDSHWESPVLADQIFDYIVPTASTSTNWKQKDFVSSGWKQGKAGIGYGDTDISSAVPAATLSVYLRKSFNLPAGFKFEDLALQLDFDDGYVAYLNGVEIARKNIDGVVTWNSVARSPHETVSSSGGVLGKEVVDVDKVRSLLVTGKNVLAIEVHNFVSTSNDLNILPFLSFKLSGDVSLFTKTPSNLILEKAINLHTNFKISNKGEKIFLYNIKSNSTETIWVRNLMPGWSIGRPVTEPGVVKIFMQPTPGLANTTKAYTTEQEPQPVFSVSEGFYTSKVNVSITTTSSTAEIRYTKDGSEPTSASTLYTGASIPVSISTIVRATSFSKAGKLPSLSVTNSYFMNKGGLTVPVISVITNNENLFGGSGIFDNWQQEWEKPCYVEYFNKDGKKEFEQFSGIQIDGGAGGSRANAQHSFRLEFNNKIYGEGDLNCKLIPDRPDRTKYKSIYIRNGSNQWMTFQFKDAMECKIMANNTNNYYSHCSPAVVYINGAYFGVYEMREKLNDEYFQVNYKATIDSTFQLLSLSYYYNSILRALNGSVETFNTDYNSFLKLNHTDPDYLKKADQILDLQYYTDYIVAQSWIADTDWPFNNIKIVKGDFTHNRWRFILQDLEWSLNPNGWSNSGTDHIDFMLKYNQDVPYIRFWLELIKDAAYKKQFISRFADIMNTSYLPENTTAITQSVYDDSYAEMPAEYAKWGGDFSQYSKNLTIFKTELTNRSTTVRDNIVSHFGLQGQYNVELQVQPANAGVIQINTIAPEVYPWTGTYFAGNSIKIEAKGTGNYVFDGWVPNVLIKDVKNPVYEGDVKTTGYKFIAKFKLKTPDDAITISEINYSSGVEFPAGDWIELYNYGAIAKDLNNWYLTDSDPSHKWVIAGTLILQPNERLVLASDLSKFKATYPYVPNVFGSFGFGLGTPSDSPQLYNSAGKLVAGVSYNIMAPWPTGAFDKGMTLELKDPTLNLNSASNWFEGCVGGSPGTAFTKCLILSNGQIKANSIAKLFPNPASDVIHVVLPSGIDNQQIICRIYDVMGKEVETIKLLIQDQNEIQLEVSGFRSGIYVIQLSGDYFKQSLKFVKQ